MLKQHQNSDETVQIWHIPFTNDDEQLQEQSICFEAEPGALNITSINEDWENLHNIKIPQEDLPKFLEVLSAMAAANAHRQWTTTCAGKDVPDHLRNHRSTYRIHYYNKTKCVHHKNVLMKLTVIEGSDLHILSDLISNLRENGDNIRVNFCGKIGSCSTDRN